VRGVVVCFLGQHHIVVVVVEMESIIREKNSNNEVFSDLKTVAWASEEVVVLVE
jgi:hypothetical protein